MTSSASDRDALIARLESLQREQMELAPFALIGQAFLGLAHELNNALNSMMLQTAVVEMRVNEQGRHELAAIRQHGAQAVGLLRMLQHVVQEQRIENYSVDLNSILSEILEEDAELGRRVSLHLSPKAPQIQNTRSAVKLLLRLVLEGVCAATQATIEAEFGEQDGDAVLNLTLAGVESEATVEELVWRNLDEVGRLAGQSLLRQRGGVLALERPGHGVAILRLVLARSA